MNDANRRFQIANIAKPIDICVFFEQNFSAPLLAAILHRSCGLRFCTAVALCNSAPHPQALAGCGLGTLRAGSYGLPTYAMRTRFAQTLIAFDGLRACSLSGSPLIRPHPVNACGRSVYRVQNGIGTPIEGFSGNTASSKGVSSDSCGLPSLGVSGRGPAGEIIKDELDESKNRNIFLLGALIKTF